MRADRLIACVGKRSGQKVTNTPIVFNDQDSCHTLETIGTGRGFPRRPKYGRSKASLSLAHPSRIRRHARKRLDRVGAKISKPLRHARSAAETQTPEMIAALPNVVGAANAVLWLAPLAWSRSIASARLHGCL
jgi:hypothetical protein